MATTSELQVIISAQDQASEVISGVGKKIESSLAGVGKISVALSAVGAIATAEISKASDTFTVLEKNIQRAGANVNATEEQLLQLKETIFNLGKTSDKSFNEIADAFYQLAGGSVSFDEAIQSLPDMVKFAEVNLMDMESSALLVTQALTLFNIEGNKTNEVLDILTKASQSGMAKLPQLADSFQMAGSYAAQFGWNIKDLTGVLISMGDAGYVGSEAGTAIKRALTSLATPGTEAKAILSELGITTKELAVGLSNPISMIEMFEGKFNELKTAQEQVAFTTALFGAGAGPAMAGLLSQGSESLKEYVTNLDNAGGTMDDLKSRIDSAEEPFQKLGKSMEQLQYNVGEATQQPLQQLATTLQPIIDKIVLWTAENPNLVSGILILGATLGAIGVTLGIVTAAVAALNLVMSMNPISLIVISIGLLIAGLIALWTNCETFRVVITEIFTNIQTIVQPFFDIMIGGLIQIWTVIQTQVLPFIAQLFTDIGNWINQMMPIIQDFFAKHKKEMDSLLLAVKIVWDAIVTVFKVAWALIEGVIKIAWAIISGFIKAGLQALNGDWTGAWNTIKETFSKVWDAIKETLTKVWNAIWEFLQKGIQDMLQIGKNLVEGLWNGINSMTGWIGEKISGFVNGITEKFKSLFGIASPSKVFAEMGKFNIEGLEQGMQKAVKNIDLPSMAANVTGIFDSILGESQYSQKNNSTEKANSSIDNSRSSSIQFTGDIVISNEMNLESVGQYLAAMVASRIY